MAYIYKLNFPNDSRVYIGQTAQLLKNRLAAHIGSLKNGSHHSYKLQKSWPECGIPSIELIAECNSSEVDIVEPYYIEYCKSYSDGFNCTVGGISGGFGENNPSAKHVLEDYTCIVFFLAYTDWTILAISEELDVGISVVRDISCQASHVYLKDIIPIEYYLMISRDRPRGARPKSTWPDLLSPTGEIFKVTNASAFAKEHLLKKSSLHLVLTGQRKSTYGWTVYKGDKVA